MSPFPIAGQIPDHFPPTRISLVFVLHFWGAEMIPFGFLSSDSGLPESQQSGNPKKQPATAAPCKPCDAETASANSSLPLKLRRLIAGETTAPWTDKWMGQKESCLLSSAQWQNPLSPNFTRLHFWLWSRIGSTAAIWGEGKGRMGAKGLCDWLCTPTITPYPLAKSQSPIEKKE